MSSFASHEPEALAGLKLEQPLDFQLRLGGAGKSYPHVNHGLTLRLSSFEGRLDEHEARTPQNSIDQKEILETVCVNRRDPAPLHSNVLPALSAKCARGYATTTVLAFASELASRHRELMEIRIRAGVPVSERNNGRSYFATADSVA